jgi:hypothetical protein
MIEHRVHFECGETGAKIYGPDLMQAKKNATRQGVKFLTKYVTKGTLLRNVFTPQEQDIRKYYRDSRQWRNAGVEARYPTPKFQPSQFSFEELLVELEC